jgi:hypothetical protein
MKNNAQPIRANSRVQTGANIQFGGDILGLIRLAYQVLIFVAVNIEPTKPANSQIIIEKTNLNIVEYFVIHR